MNKNNKTTISFSFVAVHKIHIPSTYLWCVCRAKLHSRPNKWFEREHLWNENENLLGVCVTKPERYTIRYDVRCEWLKFIKLRILIWVPLLSGALANFIHVHHVYFLLHMLWIQIEHCNQSKRAWTNRKIIDCNCKTIYYIDNLLLTSIDMHTICDYIAFNLINLASLWKII